jgi:hypothetical protein
MIPTLVHHFFNYVDSLVCLSFLEPLKKILFGHFCVRFLFLGSCDVIPFHVHEELLRYLVEYLLSQLLGVFSVLSIMDELYNIFS